MKNFINLIFLLFIFQGFCQGKYMEIDSSDNGNNENFIYGIIKENDVSIYSKPEFASKVLQKVNIGDSIKIFNYYQGKPYTKILFWVTEIGKEEAYIYDVYVKNNKLNSFKVKIDSLRNEKVVEAEKVKLKEKELNNRKCEYEKNEKDVFDNTFKKFTPLYEVAEYQLQLQLKKYDSELYLVAESYHDLGCTSSYKNNRSYMKIKLMNDKLLTFYHRGDIDCGGFSLFARVTNNEIDILKKSPIKSIRLSGTDYYQDIEKIEFKTFFIDKLKCIE